ncbi:MAG: hypothetical protein PF442_03155 [Desulfobulbaceae bacterium]|jgi:DNA gyrase inhibitor GyrI|nr:hypothetical protein [Desulfobulbaceae bacterium]
MKKVSQVFVGCTLLFIAILAAVFAWYGYFSTVAVQEKPIGPFVMVYKKHVGPPAQAAGVMAEVRQSLTDEFHVQSLLNFGLYYDNPKTVDPAANRALIGCIVQDDQDGDLQEISKKYTVATLPRGMAAVADFTYRNNLSILFGELKGYGALVEYSEEQQIGSKPVLELYDRERKRIRYVLSLDFERSFYDPFLAIE